MSARACRKLRGGDSLAASFIASVVERIIERECKFLY